MRNTIIWGFDSPISCKAINALQEKSMIDIKAWFGDPESHYTVAKVSDWMDILRNKLEAHHFIRCNSETYDYIYQHLPVIQDVFSRNFLFLHSDFHEYINAMHMVMDYLYCLVTKNNIELILFDDIPHGPANYILYLLAKKVGIKVLILSQSHFPNRFYYFKTIEDYGWFNEVPEYRGSEELSPLNSNRKSPFYMEKDWDKKLRPKISFEKWKQKRLNKWKKSYSKYQGIADYLLRKPAYRVINACLEKNYTQKIEKLFKDNINVSDKFVYFPLHLQPEMTTSVLGGIYANQLLAVERLSAMLPEDWRVYIKEYPGQTQFMRGKYFFERLRRIPKVKMVAPGTNTFDLIEKSQFVATLVGTAGWEAINQGKKTLVFGQAWYRSLPGVFEYSTKLMLEEMLNYKIDSQDLQIAIAALLKKTGDAMVSYDYLPLVSEDFCPEENNKKLFNFFSWILPKL